MISWFSFFIYRTCIVPCALFLIHRTRKFLPEKIKSMIEEREAAHWPQVHSRPIWIHAASGEIEYAKPLIRRLKEAWPQRLILVTYFSPSAKKLFKSMGNVDLIVPLPWDEKKEVTRFLNHFKPELFLISRTDVWPEFAYQAHQRHIPSILFAATFATESSRQGLFASPMTRFAFNQLTLIDCVSEEDAAAIRRLKTRTRVVVAGDTRYDQVLWRLQNPFPLTKAFRAPDSSSEHPVFIAGSTWPQDEAVVLPALVPFLNDGGRAIIAPHEVNPERTHKLLSQLKGLGFSACLFSETQAWDGQSVLVIDQVGSLQEIYSWGDLAFVGGSFKDKVHSVMEPLAAGLPVFVGPLHANNREALHFQHVRIDKMPAVTVVHDSDDLAQGLKSFRQKQIRSGLKAKVAAKAGASDELMQQVTDALSNHRWQ